MATITILDTGYIDVDEGGTQETFIANAGTAITLKTVDLSYSRGQTIDNSPIPGTKDTAELNPVSTTNPLITINGKLDRSSTADMLKIVMFDNLVRSKGIKLLYYNSTAADVSAGGGTDGWSNVISSLGIDNVDGNLKSGETVSSADNTVSDVHTQSGGELYNSGDPIPHLHIYVKNFRVSQSSNPQFLSYALTIEVTVLG